MLTLMGIITLNSIFANMPPTRFKLVLGKELASTTTVGGVVSYVEPY